MPRQTKKVRAAILREKAKKDKKLALQIAMGLPLANFVSSHPQQPVAQKPNLELSVEDEETLNVVLETPPSPTPVDIKEEPSEEMIDFDIPSDIKEEHNSLSDPIGGALVPEVLIEQHCKFCLRSLPEEDFVKCVKPDIVEYVLATSLEPGDVNLRCCQSCWQMFELFDGFKKSCLMALTNPDSLFASMKASIRTVQKPMILPKKVFRAAPKPSSKPKLVAASKVKKEKKPIKRLVSCQLCMATFSDTRALGSHINQHYGIKLYRCRAKDCAMDFYSNEEKTKHEKKCAKRLSIVPPKKQSEFKCQLCTAIFSTRKTLSEHELTHFQKPNLPSSTAEEPLDNNHSAIHDVPSSVDVIAPNIDAIPPSIDAPVPPIVSEDIEQGAAQDDSFEFEPCVPCTVCGTEFSSVETFVQHKKYCHVKKSTEHPFRCSQCPATFTREDKLNHHVNKHNGVRSVPCRKAGCNKMFYNLKARGGHEQLCGKEPGQFMCSTCGAVLNTSASLRFHMTKHAAPKYSCEICGKSFLTKFSLIKHGPVHTGERNFACEICGKKFKSYEANRVHQRIHTQEKPYACNVCDQRFAYNCMLKAHLTKGHLGDPVRERSYENDIDILSG